MVVETIVGGIILILLLGWWTGWFGIPEAIRKSRGGLK